MRKILLIILGLALFVPAYADTIDPLPQFVSTSSPSSAITQRTFGKALKITGLTTGQCLALDSNSIVTTAACSGGSGGGNTFGQGWEINASGYLAPTTTLDVLIPQALQFITNDLPTKIFVDSGFTPQDNIEFLIGNSNALVVTNNGVQIPSTAGIHTLTDQGSGINITDGTSITSELSSQIYTTVGTNGFTVNTGSLILNGMSDGCLTVISNIVSSTGSSCGGGGGSGTVTSVDMTVPTGLSISGNPVTTSGTLALTLTSGYSIPITSTLWATSSAAYYTSQFRDWSLQGSPLYLAPTTSRAILINNATSTITNIQVVNGTTTNATSTNLAISSIVSSLLKTNGNGLVLAAVPGQDYLSAAFRDWSVQGNGYLAPTTTRGLIISASSTISALTSTTGTTTFATSTTFNASTTLSLGGANFSTITNTGNGNLTLTAAGSNQNIVINPSGTGSTQFNSSASFPFNIQTSVAVASLPTGIGIGGTNAGANGSLILWARNNSSAQIQFATNNALVGLFDSNGNFGISTTSPYQKLSVAGDSYTSGTSTSSRLGLISSSTPTYSPGTMVYDARCDCMTVYNSDNVVSLQVGQEEWIKVFNNTGSTILNGSAVYTTGSTGVTPTIALANANSAATTIVVGLATEDILNNATGTVTTIGVVNGLNTTGMTAGATVFLSTTTPGGLVPYSGKSPFYRYRVGIVTAVSATVGAIHVTPSTAFIGNGNPFSVLQINAAGNQSFTNELLITGSTTLQNFTALKATTTSATTTTFAISSLATSGGTYLAVDPNGVVIATTSPLAINSNASAYKQASNWATVAVLAGTPTYSNGSSGVGATLTEVGTGALTVDGNSPSAGDRVLVKNQASGFQNGIYTVTATGSGIASYILTRSTDFNNVNDIFPGVATYIIGGATNLGDTYVLTTTGVIVVGTTNLTFAELAPGAISASNGITLTGSALSLDQTFAAVWSALEKFTAGILVNNSTSTITNLQVVNGTTTNATSTNLVASGSLVIPFATTPSVITSGQTAVNTTAASTSLRFYDGTASRALYSTRSHSLAFASSSLAYAGAYGASGTTTVLISNNIRPTTLISFYCKTDTGTAHVDFSTGSNHTVDVACTSSGVSSGALSSNNTFTMRQDLKVNVGTISSAPNVITITGDIREDAD